MTIPVAKAPTWRAIRGNTSIAAAGYAALEILTGLSPDDGFAFRIHEITLHFGRFPAAAADGDSVSWQLTRRQKAALVNLTDRDLLLNTQRIKTVSTAVGFSEVEYVRKYEFAHDTPDTLIVEGSLWHAISTSAGIGALQVPFKIWGELIKISDIDKAVLLAGNF